MDTVASGDGEGERSCGKDGGGSLLGGPWLEVLTLNPKKGRVRVAASIAAGGRNLRSPA